MRLKSWCLAFHQLALKTEPPTLYLGEHNFTKIVNESSIQGLSSEYFNLIFVNWSFRHATDFSKHVQKMKRLSDINRQLILASSNLYWVFLPRFRPKYPAKNRKTAPPKIFTVIKVRLIFLIVGQKWSWWESDWLQTTTQYHRYNNCQETYFFDLLSH